MISVDMYNLLFTLSGSYLQIPKRNRGHIIQWHDIFGFEISYYLASRQLALFPVNSRFYLIKQGVRKEFQYLICDVIRMNSSAHKIETVSIPDDCCPEIDSIAKSKKVQSKFAKWVSRAPELLQYVDWPVYWLPHFLLIFSWVLIGLSWSIIEAFFSC